MLYVYILRPLFKYPWRLLYVGFMAVVFVLVGLVCDPKVFAHRELSEAAADLKKYIKTGRM